MSIINIPLIKLSSVALISVVLAACQSAPTESAGASVINGQHVDQIAINLQSLMEKQEQHDQLLTEWQQLKPALKRLAVVEEELSLLIEQLEQHTLAAVDNQKNAEQSAIPQSQASAAARISPTEPVKGESIDQRVASTADKRFSLQITSLSDPLRLPVVWQQLQRKYPAELGDLEPNFEKIKVGNEDYYRLKVGAFADKQQATNRCSQLKNLSINCLVSSYIASDFATLSNL